MNTEEFKSYLMAKYTPKMTKSILTGMIGLAIAFISFLIWFIWKTKISLFTGCIGIAILLISLLMYFYIKHQIKLEADKFKA